MLAPGSERRENFIYACLILNVYNEVLFNVVMYGFEPVMALSPLGLNLSCIFLVNEDILLVSWC